MWSGTPEEGTTGAASASLKDGRVLLWGGLDEARNAVDSLYAFEDGAWTPVETTGFKPQKAMYAAAATQSLVGTSGKEEFVVCGGWDPGEKGSGGSFSDAVHALDVNKLEWQKDDPLPCGPVSRHAAATVGGTLCLTVSCPDTHPGGSRVISGDLG